MSESGSDMFRSGVTHNLPIADFDSLATGGGDTEIIRRLIASEYSRRLILLYELLGVMKDEVELLGPLPPASEAWRLLHEIEDRSPADLEAVLLHPQVGVWFAHTLRRIRYGATDDAPIWVGLGHLYSVILAAAVRGGVDTKLQVPVRRGVVVLPTLGIAHIGPAGEYRVADAEARDNGVVLRLDGHSLVVERVDEPAVGWWNLRRLHLLSEKRALNVFLDDIDPYRDLADPVEPGRLDDPSVASWRDRLGAGWRIIDRFHPGRADAMRAGLWSITPLPENPGWEVRSASTGDAFGAVLMSLPADPQAVAVTMVHEFQHNKLGALLHLVDLTAGIHREPCLYAPWRPDPRPAAGLLQGVYAFLGITGFWFEQRTVRPTTDAATADFEFALARRQAWAGWQALHRCGELTEWGRRFVEGMGRPLRSWLRESVPPHTDRAARALFLDHRAGWRLRNLEVDPGWVGDAVAAWADGRDPPPTAAARVRVRPGNSVWPHRRLQFYRGMSVPDEPMVPRGDVLLLQGDGDRAEAEYVQAIARSPGDFDAWAGLGLAVAAQPGRREWRALLGRSELVKAVHDALKDVAARPSPLTAARWLAG